MLKQVMVYTVSLLVAPMPLMPFEPGTRAFAGAGIICSIIVFLGSHYVVQHHVPLRRDKFIGNRLLIAAYMTRIFAVGLLMLAVVFLGTEPKQ